MAHKVSAIIVAGGSGSRMKSDIRKQYLVLDKIPILTRTLTVFETIKKVDLIILVIPEQDRQFCRETIISPFGFNKVVGLVNGGGTRQESVSNALEYIRGKKLLRSDDIVMIHDGVRPFVDQQIIENCIKGASIHGACIPAVQISDTVKRADQKKMIRETLKRENLYLAQTPQTFRYGLISEAFEHARLNFFSATDDASIAEYFGSAVQIVQGSKNNLKITTREDLDLGKYLLTLKSS